ncbi:Transcriptional regulator, HxlR family [Planococcus halocryophilus Or1]|uniref:MarR family transcriptional regulator n=1 Tax=Planococcus halocryophilus TaxID=1215089 RepID=A0A1C7DSV8_9BACL|nr:helix-turn-helix domain-containing protein [Planococcus halocryophilus]ANU14596.1 MarR family transcriptional regulator [Planococcus halocryophilus]EMF46771.1 Transcriptional regulator, HxlR family [Planococcus halocryophilus Or1]
MAVKNNYVCSLGLTIDLIGGKWKLMILWYLIEDSKRFGELKKSIPNISQKVLTEQLKELESSQIISRKVYATVPVKYAMTAYGESLIPLIHDLCDWTKQYASENDIEISGD